MSKEGVMKVAILTDTMDRVGMGTALYTRKLVENLIPLFEGGKGELYLVHSKKVDDPLYTQAHEIVMQEIPIPKLRRILTEAWFLWSTRNDFDVIHFPQEANHYLFFLTNARVVMTMHSHIDGWRLYGMKSRYGQVRRTLRYFGKKFAALLTPSESTKRGIVELFGVPTERVHVIPLAAGEWFDSAPTREVARKEVAERYSVKPPFVLSPSRSDPQKNVPRIVEAFARAKKKANFPHTLLLGSRHRADEDKKIDDIIAKYGLTDVHFLPRVNFDEMPLLYASADVTMYPSLHEGFGLPVVESMASGTPVITGTAYAMPESAGGAALLVDPTDIDAIADALISLVSNPTLQEEMIKKGKERVQKLSWKNVAHDVFAVYESVCLQK